jgi:CBS-domain-containing membrane protein
MPFIIIDQGGPAIRHYQPPKAKGVNAIHPSVASSQVETHEAVSPIRNPYQGQHTLPQKKVTIAAEIMKHPVISLPAKSASIQNAKHLLAEHHIKHLPITQDGRLIAITSETDILRHQVSTSEYPNWILRKVFAATPTMDIRQLAHVMFDEHIGSMPIVDEEHQLIGIVTRSDILRITSQYGPVEFWA